jgi:acetyl-CoA carboxylase biotin carboxyl carrier protein
MSESDGQREALLQAIDAATASLVPQLTERLARHGLGEIEVKSGDLRVRVVAPGSATGDAAALPAMQTARPAGQTRPSVSKAPTPTTATALGVTSPAVGYFAYIDALGPGLSVEKGDALGYVDVLGVRHDVRAPRSGVVRNLVTEAGEAVEYGQLLIELEAAAS